MLRIAWRFSLISYFVWQLCDGFRRSVVRISFFRKKKNIHHYPPGKPYAWEARPGQVDGERGRDGKAVLVCEHVIQPSSASPRPRVQAVCGMYHNREGSIISDEHNTSAPPAMAATESVGTAGSFYAA